MPLSVRRIDRSHAASLDAAIAVLDTYVADPIGLGRPMDAATSARLRRDLAEHPTCEIFLAERDGAAVGAVFCFRGYSTFAGAPLVNVHDLAVVPAARGTGVGTALLAAVEEFTRSIGGCKVTLEVSVENPRAEALYRRLGYGDPGAPNKFLAKKV